MAPYDNDEDGGMIQDLQWEVSRSVFAHIGFLERDAMHEHEEPYAFRYKAEVPVPLTNMRTEFRPLRLCDLRGQEASASLDTCGFSILRLRSSMRYEQFENEKDIQNIYLRDLKLQLLDEYMADRADIVRVRVRRRHTDFPQSKGVPFQHHQPSTAAHIDTSASSASTKVREYGEDFAESANNSFLILNAWKPLRGPLEDWPLGVCDARTVDTENDLAEATILHENFVNHNCQVRFNERQLWYYLRHQQEDELLVFRQYDSRIGGNNGVPHSSFEDPTTPPTATPRESVEVMMILHFD